MADEKYVKENMGVGASAGAAAQAPVGLTPNNVKGQRGGEQTDQISGETVKGAQNQEKQNRNPSGNKANQSQSDRQEGDTF